MNLTIIKGVARKRSILTISINMPRVCVVVTLLLLACKPELDTVNATSFSIDQMKEQFDAVEKRLCAEPLPDEQQLETLENCNPATKIFVSTIKQLKLD